jgi:hypothetical protein
MAGPPDFRANVVKRRALSDHWCFSRPVAGCLVLAKVIQLEVALGRVSSAQVSRSSGCQALRIRAASGHQVFSSELRDLVVGR